MALLVRELTKINRIKTACLTDMYTTVDRIMPLFHRPYITITTCLTLQWESIYVPRGAASLKPHQNSAGVPVRDGYTETLLFTECTQCRSS